MCTQFTLPPYHLSLYHRLSMSEVPHPREYHRDVVFIASADGIFVTHRTAGLDDGRYANLRRFIDAVTEGEESITGQDHGLLMHADQRLLGLIFHPTHF